MRPRLSGTTAGLAVAVTAVVVAASALGAWLYSRHHFEELVASARDTSVAQGELIREALEHQMMENDRSLIGEMVDSFARQPGVTRVLILDRQGAVRFAAGSPTTPADLRPDSPTCQACHRLSPSERGSSRVVETHGRDVLRTVIPFRNRTACHGCHDPGHGINGIMILDRDTDALRASMDADLPWLVAGTGGLALLLIGALALVLRLALLRRLQRFETTARLVAGGDLTRRVPQDGSDTIAWLAREFNAMADSMARLLGEVRSQRERLEKIINSVDDGIVVLGPDRSVLAANDAFLQRTGCTRAQVSGVCCRSLPAGTCTAATCPTLACLATGRRQVQLCERRRPDGTTAWEEIHASPILGASGAVDHVVEVWRDISERRKAEARLSESHRLASLGLLASGFSHEMNTPLATVLTCVEGIMADSRGPVSDDALERIAGSAAIAREQVLRCRGITQHFLRLSRGQRLPLAPLPLASVVAQVVRLVEPTAREQRVSVEVGSVAEETWVRADEAGLQHALINLLLNGIQACEPGGHVRVEVETGTEVHVRIADDGCGIAPEHQERIFEPFYGLRRGGSGLGLFLVQDAVRAAGGDVLVTSAPGRGSTFEVVLPAESSHVAEASAS